MKKELPEDKITERSEIDQQILHAYFDGELTGSQSDAMRQRAAAGDPEITLAREELQFFRTSLREFVELERKAGEQRHGAISLWESIELDLQGLPESARPAFIAELRRRFERFGRLLNPISRAGLDATPGMRWIRPPAFGVAFAAALLLFYFGSPSTTSVNTSTNVSLVTGSTVTGTNLASAASGSESNTMNGNQSSIPLVALTANSSVGFHGSVPLSGNRTQRVPFLRDVPLRMDSDQLIGTNPISGGLRTDGLDIEWIKTKRPFKILPSTSRTAPPVIWVARSTR